MNPSTSHRRAAGEIACAGALLALGLFVLLYGFRYPMFKDGVIGPGMMPAVAAAALTVAAGTLLWKALRPAHARMAAQNETQQPQELSLADFSDEDPEAAGKPGIVAGILGMLALTALLTPVFGLIPMTGVLVFVCLFVFERQRIGLSLALATGCTLLSWLLFVKLFDVNMPAGNVWKALGL